MPLPLDECVHELHVMLLASELSEICEILESFGDQRQIPGCYSARILGALEILVGESRFGAAHQVEETRAENGRAEVAEEDRR